MSERHTSKRRAEPAKFDRHETLPSNSQARMIARTGLTIALVVLALWIAADFLPALGWAAIIAITAWPLYVRCIPYLGETRSPILAFSFQSRSVPMHRVTRLARRRQRMRDVLHVLRVKLAKSKRRHTVS